MVMNKTPKGIFAKSSHRPNFVPNNDPYKNQKKLSEPTICESCGAVYKAGRWQWLEVSADASKVTCPACLRIQENQPAGFVTLEGDFFHQHYEEIINLIENHVRHEHEEHPLKRIIKMEKNDSTILITTTDTHLARGIGEAIHHAYQGKLKTDLIANENLIKVHWIR